MVTGGGGTGRRVDTCEVILFAPSALLILSNFHKVQIDRVNIIHLSIFQYISSLYYICTSFCAVQP